MKPQVLIISLGIFLSLIISADCSFGQIKEQSFSLSPQIGGYLFEGNQDLDHGFTFGAGLGYNFTKHWASEFVLDIVPTENSTTGADVDAYLYRLDGLYHFRPESRLVPYLGAGIGGITLDPKNGGNTDYFAINYGGGLKYFIKENIALRGDVRHVISFGDTHSNLIYTAALAFIFGGGKEAMPSELDSDGDGVTDGKDKCPNTPMGTLVDSQGCPMDSDGDGVPDSLDKCPDTPRGVSVDANGCPLDRDGDGVADYLDRCPGTPAGISVETDGCPPDSDGDGVADYLDKCPDTPMDLKVTADGCPIVMKEKVTIDIDIRFDTDKTDIKPQYFNQLKKVADFMATYPETKAVIEGHSDSVGPAAYNKKLSQRRADSVRMYLINNFNIDPSRISAIGFGEQKPIASNDTEEGRSQNRRIQAVLSAETEIYEKR